MSASHMMYRSYEVLDIVVRVRRHKDVADWN